MGVPYFYAIALIAAIGETIPIVALLIGGALMGLAGAISAIPPPPCSP